MNAFVALRGDESTAAPETEHAEITWATARAAALEACDRLTAFQRDYYDPACKGPGGVTPLVEATQNLFNEYCNHRSEAVERLLLLRAPDVAGVALKMHLTVSCEIWDMDVNYKVAEAITADLERLSKQPT